MKTFTFIQVQAGYWGQTKLTKTRKVKAETPWEAVGIVNASKGAYRRLRNGDYLSWELVDINGSDAIVNS